jgi:hypothetical protein
MGCNYSSMKFENENISFLKERDEILYKIRECYKNEWTINVTKYNSDILSDTLKKYSIKHFKFNDGNNKMIMLSITNAYCPKKFRRHLGYNDEIIVQPLILDDALADLISLH